MTHGAREHAPAALDLDPAGECGDQPGEACEAADEGQAGEASEVLVAGSEGETGSSAERHAHFYSHTKCLT